MSDMHSDPQQPEVHSATTELKPSGQMAYMRSLTFIFENPNWFQNLAFTAICFIIPVVGPLLIYGYQFEIVETLHTRRGASYPDFDFNRFSDYLMRGLWVFLVFFILGIATFPIMIGLFGLGFALVGGVGAAGGEEAAQMGMAIVIPLVFLAFFVCTLVLNMFTIPFILRAGLTQDLGASFDFRFAKQFVANTWGQMIVTGLFFFMAIIVLEMLGLAIMCVGIFFTIAAGMLMQAHLIFQLYEVHLARGGDSIPIQPPKPN